MLTVCQLIFLCFGLNLPVVPNVAQLADFDLCEIPPSAADITCLQP